VVRKNFFCIKTYAALLLLSAWHLKGAKATLNGLFIKEINVEKTAR